MVTFKTAHTTADCAEFSILGRASRDVQDAYPSLKCYKFNARWTFIVTWHNVTFFGATTVPYPVMMHVT